jgi:hypothetical protein
MTLFAQKKIILNFHLYHAIFFQKFGYFFRKKGNTAQNIPFLFLTFTFWQNFSPKRNAGSKLYIFCFLVHIMAFNDIYIFSFNYFVNSY